MQTLLGWTPLTVVDDRRDYTVFSLPHPTERGEFRFLVEWDEDRDPRVLGAVLALYYRHPQLFDFVTVWSEHKAHLTVYTRPGTAVKEKDGRADPIPVAKALAQALSGIVGSIDGYTGYAVGDHWTVDVQPFEFDLRLAGIHRLHSFGLVRS